MLAYVLWDSIGKKFGRLPNIEYLLKQYFRLTRTYNLGTKCEEVVCTSEQVRELRFETAISFCILQFAFCNLQFAFCILQFTICILHFSKFAGGKNILFQTHSQIRIAIVICWFANLKSACINNTEYTYATRDDRKLATVRFLAVSTLRAQGLP